MMIRVIGAIAVAALVSATGTQPRAGTGSVGIHQSASLDVAALLASAHGAPPIMCSLAAKSIRGDNWSRSFDAPVSPLGATNDTHDASRYDDMSAADLTRLFAGLASDDQCVREISIRLIGDQKSSVVAPELLSRLGATDASMRTIAALGLGLVHAKIAADRLVSALRDATPDVRANSAWALGRLEDGHALSSLVRLFSDDAPMVRLAAVIAVGGMDSTSSVEVLTHTLQHDDVASVRRAAAWAIGELGARGATAALSAALLGDADARVREMSAWALARADEDGEPGIAALESALHKDSDASVRESAAWALGQNGGTSATDALAAAAESDNSTKVRGTAAWAIGHIGHGDSHAVASLTHLLKSDDDETRLKAAWALGQIRDSSALSSVGEALTNEKNADVRRALVRAFTRSGGNSPRLMSGLLDSRDPNVREAAVRALAGNRSLNPWPWPWPRPRPWP